MEINSASQQTSSQFPNYGNKFLLSSRLKLFWPILVCIVVPFIIYINALNTPFVFDDLGAIVKNPAIKEISNIQTRLFSQISSYKWGLQAVRPLTYFTFILNYHWGELNPFGYHLVNIIIHSLVTVFIFLLTQKVFFYSFGKETILPPLYVALFFGVHPMNVDVVTHVIHRSDSLATLFYLMTLYFFLKAIEKHKGYLILSFICPILSMASKQIGATFPATIFLFDYIFVSNMKIEKVMKKKYLHFCYWALLLLIVGVMYLHLGHLHLASVINLEWTRTNYFLTQIIVILKYIHLLIFPIGQCIDHAVRPVLTFFDFRLDLSIVVWATIFVWAYFICKRHSSISKLILFSILWFFITLIPTSSFIPLPEDPMAEKRVYISGWGFCLGIVSLYPLILKNFFLKGDQKKRDTSFLFENWFWGLKSKLLFIVMSLHILLLSIATWQRNKIYRTPVLLWEDAVRKYPHNDRALLNLGFHYNEQKEFKKAQQVLEKAVQLNTKKSVVYSNLGNVYDMQGEYNKAIRTFQRAIILDPNNLDAYNNMGIVYVRQKEYTKARKFFMKAVELEPNFTEAFNNLKLIEDLKESGTRHEKDVEEITADFKDPKQYNSQGNFYAKLKEYEKAIESYQRAIQIDPNYAVAYYNLGNVYRDKKEHSKAIEYYRKAIQISPNYSVAYFNLGNIYAEQKEYDLALREYKTALTLSPGNPYVEEKIKLLKKLTK